MDRMGVARQVLSAPPLLQAYSNAPEHVAELARDSNAHLIDVCRQAPDRFAMLGMLPLGDPRATDAELERLHGDESCVGVSLPAYTYDRVIADRERTQAWRGIADLGVVLVHPADTALCEADRSIGAVFGAAMVITTARTAVHMITSGLLDRVPDLQVLLAHAGGCFPSLLGRLEYGFSALGRNGNLLASPKAQVRRSFWADSVAYDDLTVQHAADVFGHDRIVYGSDYPFDAVVTPRDLDLRGGERSVPWLDTVRGNGEALWSQVRRARKPPTGCLPASG